MPSNIKNELATIDLGDERRDRRVKRLAATLAASPALSVSGACCGFNETKAAYRLVHNESSDPEKVLAAHRDASLERARECDSLLLIQDTTELDYTKYSSMDGTGPISSPERRGFFLHSYLLIAEEEGVPLGICGTQMWSRDDQEHGKNVIRKLLPIEQKESMRWLDGYTQACEISQALSKPVAMVADRECDIYEIFAQYDALAQKQQPRADFIVRASHDRALDNGSMLFETVFTAPVIGQYEIEVSEKIQNKKTSTGSRQKTLRKARLSMMEVRTTRVTLRPPYRPDKQLSTVELTVICAKEKNPPPDQPPVQWIVLTNLNVKKFSQAQRILKAYAARWLVEEYHRTLKSGCKVESLRFGDVDAVQLLLSLYIVIAWRILYLRDLSRCAPTLPGSDFFAAPEWKSACLMKKRSPTRAPTLEEMIHIVGEFGGFRRTKTSPFPGPECLWRGLVKLQHYTEALSSVGVV